MGPSFNAENAASRVDAMMDEMYRFVSQCSNDEVATDITPLSGVITTLETLAAEYVDKGVVCGLGPVTLKALRGEKFMPWGFMIREH